MRRKNVLECLIVDGVKMMEFQHVLADVEPELFLDLAAQGLQQAVPSCLVTLGAPIYLDLVRQCDAPFAPSKEEGVRSMSYHETPGRIVELCARHV